MKNILLLILLLIVLVVQLYGVPYNQEFRVNTFTQDSQRSPCVSSLPDGGFVVCWESDNQDGSSYGIFGQLFDKFGEKDGNEFQVNSYTDDRQMASSISSLSDGSFIICWESYRQDGSGYGIYGQLFNENGQKKNLEFLVNTDTLYTKQTPSISSLPDGRFIVCWQSFRQDGSRNGIYGQLFDVNGEKSGCEFRLNTYTKDDQCTPCISSLPDGGFVVCWETFEQDGDLYGVYGQLFDKNGAKKGNEFRVNLFGHDQQREPTVSSLADSSFIVCWYSSCSADNSGSGIYGQLFDLNGERKGSEFRVNTYTDGEKRYPSVSGLSDSGFVVSWQQSEQDGSGWGICCQIFDQNYKKRGDQFVVNTYTNSQQANPNVWGSVNGGFIVSWQSYLQDGSDFGVYAKYYTREINHVLTLYSLLTPKHDALVETTDPVFNWRQASQTRINLPWELEYDLYLDNNENFTNPQIIKAIYDTTYQVDSLIPGTTYFWKVLAKNIAGDSLWSSETNGFFVSENATSVDEVTSENSKSLELLSNYPNPFNPETTIKYTLPAGQASYHVVIKIMDALGRVVQVLKEAEQSSGLYSIQWNAQDNPSGVYFCVIQAGEFKAVRKMMVMR